MLSRNKHTSRDFFTFAASPFATTSAATKRLVDGNLPTPEETLVGFRVSILSKIGPYTEGANAHPADEK
jgi:hypothetical protein